MQNITARGLLLDCKIGTCTSTAINATVTHKLTRGLLPERAPADGILRDPILSRPATSSHAREAILLRGPWVLDGSISMPKGNNNPLGIEIAFFRKVAPPFYFAAFSSHILVCTIMIILFPTVKV